MESLPFNKASRGPKCADLMFWAVTIPACAMHSHEAAIPHGEKMDKQSQNKSAEGEDQPEGEQLHDDETAGREPSKEDPNPPRTTTGWLTTPKFGSSTSGGGEIEPGPERD